MTDSKDAMFAAAFQAGELLQDAITVARDALENDNVGNKAVAGLLEFGYSVLDYLADSLLPENENDDEGVDENENEGEDEGENEGVDEPSDENLTEHTARNPVTFNVHDISKYTLEDWEKLLSSLSGLDPSKNK